jgi:hypothetical protein
MLRISFGPTGPRWPEYGRQNVRLFLRGPIGEPRHTGTDQSDGILGARDVARARWVLDGEECASRPPVIGLRGEVHRNGRLPPGKQRDPRAADRGNRSPRPWARGIILECTPGPVRNQRHPTRVACRAVRQRMCRLRRGVAHEWRHCPRPSTRYFRVTRRSVLPFPSGEVETDSSRVSCRT